MSPFEDALANAKLHLWVFGVSLCCSFFLNVYLALLLFHTPDHLRVYIPAPLLDHGMILHPDQVSKAKIYGFAYYVWQGVNSYGAKDWHIQDYKNFLSPNFYQEVLAKRQSLIQAHLWHDHRQIALMHQGSSPEESVEYLGQGRWRVKVVLDQTLLDNVSHKDQPDEQQTIYHAAMVYELIIERAENAWGLAIVSYGHRPYMLKDEPHEA